MQFDEAFDDRQPQTGAGALVIVALDTLERLQDAVALLLRDAGPAVGDGYLDRVAVACGGKLDVAQFRREGDGVG